MFWWWLDLSRKYRWRYLLTSVLTAVLIWSWYQEEPVSIAPVSALPAAKAKERPLYMVRTSEKKLALTFDISWGTKMPGPVLDVLKQNGVKATFFLSGPWSERYPEVVRRIQADGHEIQSHGHKHVNFSGLSREGVISNIRSAHRILAEITGREPTMIRPPNGDFNDLSVATAREVGYEPVIWSVDSRDWMNPGVDQIANRVLKLAHPGAIILLHASDSCKQTDQALPLVIKGLRDRGFEFVLMQDLLRLGPPAIPTLAPDVNPGPGGA